jgi:tetratricopeptide (TPR) repeat protein/transglutaminase-like putative cysteine protease
MIRQLLVVACALWSIGQARADDVLHFGAQPAWASDIAEPAPGTFDGAITVRLMSMQLRYDGDGTHQVTRQIMRVNTPEGLQLAGTIYVIWQPALGNVTVNRVMIHRGAEAIDVMKDGKGFQILRRESQLESAMINGLLTAVLQVPDLRVGDEVELVYTTDTNNPVLAGHAETLLPFNELPAADRLTVKVSWPVGRAVKSAVGSAAPTPILTKANGFQTATLTRDHWTKPEVPATAPDRYSRSALVQFSDFADWEAVAALMRPLYVTAATIAPDSPVMAEVKRITALSNDPRVRATEALKAVQSQVRYLARVDGLGGYKPASADSVWSGRSGDCKGKTVLLLAMLHALGISADAALVSATDGDGLDTALPMPGRFDHVIVRAVIDGKVYWLDGTRFGDGNIDRIAIPGFKWALPLDAQAPKLVALVPADPTMPESELTFDLDARAGLDKPAKASGTVTYRGEGGSRTRVMLAMLGATDRDNLLRKVWTSRFDFVTVSTVASKIDDQSGDVTLSFTGTADMDWSGEDYGSKSYEADGARVGKYLKTKRDKNPDAAPVDVEGDYSAYRETILLPDGGKGFSLDGEAVDRTIGGVHYQRTVALKGDRFEMTTMVRNKPAEISYADAKAADDLVDDLWKKRVFVRAPVGAVIAAKPGSKTDEGGAGEAGTVLVQVSQAWAAGKNDEALKLLDARIAGGDKSVQVLAGRGYTLTRLGRFDEASTAFDQALAVDSRFPMAIVGKAEVLQQKGRFDDALILYDRLVLLFPDKVESYTTRAQARAAAGQYDGALADLDVAIGKEPANVQARTDRVRIYSMQSKRDAALTDARELVKLKPDDATAHVLLANVLAVMGQLDEALAETSKSIAIEPSGDAYYVRLQWNLRPAAKDQLEDALGQIKEEPERDIPLVVLRKLAADPAAKAALLAAYDKEIAEHPAADAIAMQRAMVAAVTGDGKTLLPLIDKQLAKHPSDWIALNSACWTRATLKLDLDTALAQCEKSVTANRVAANLDSRGLVHFQRGEWAAAIKDMDDALALAPKQAGSLYVRGVARKRLGDNSGSKADLDAAAAISKAIGNTYAGYGVVP